MYFCRHLEIKLITLMLITPITIAYATTIIDPVIHFTNGRPLAGDSIEAPVSDWENYRPVLENAVLMMIKNPHSKYKSSVVPIIESA